ncbi:MAG: arsenate reductase [Acinetobacter sp.]|nr:MAG: arsenate reductase [Acinetobacter sp.]
MLKIYGIKNCNSMKKAFTALDAQGLAYEFHDYKKQGMTADKLQAWLEQAGQDLILNKKGTTWKKLSPEQQAYALQNQAQLIETLINHPSMIKRPVLETAQGLVIGFDAEHYQQLT